MSSTSSAFQKETPEFYRSHEAFWVNPSHLGCPFDTAAAVPYPSIGSTNIQISSEQRLEETADKVELCHPTDGGDHDPPAKLVSQAQIT